MAKRTLNRRQLRRDAEPAPEKKGEGAGPARTRKPPKKKVPVRLCARWGVFDGGMKQVAVFDYSQRGAADQKVADLNARKGGGYFLQIVKEPMPAPPAAPG